MEGVTWYVFAIREIGEPEGVGCCCTFYNLGLGLPGEEAPGPGNGELGIVRLWYAEANSTQYKKNQPTFGREASVGCNGRKRDLYTDGYSSS